MIATEVDTQKIQDEILQFGVERGFGARQMPAADARAAGWRQAHLAGLSAWRKGEHHE